MSRRTLRWAVSAATLALVATTAGLNAQPAAADDSSTVTIVGTSDVFDSALVQDIIQPGFQAAYPQYKLNYVSKGTGAAILYAEAGTASGLLVHAAALENQFVANGYSAETYGRALFYGDYVLLGPASDPAGVLNGGTHDIVTAFKKVAAAGAAGTANFVSRGGTPGTTVQEHAIWGLTGGATTTCTVSDANGGGQSPSTAGGSCPQNITYPSWYHATGLTQGPNIINGETCNYPSNNNDCYVLTDRGTFNFLQFTGAIHNLKIVTRDNTVPGQTDLLVNSFHGYVLDAAKFASNPNVQINTAGATAFLDWVTSRKGQALIGSYLDQTGDAPFLPSASPSITSNPLPTQVTGGSRVVLKGTVANVVPGTPPLAGIKVRLKARKGGDQRSVATGVTTSTGAFKIAFHPRHNATYTLNTSKLNRIERPDLSPVFADQLSPAKLALGAMKVQGAVKVKGVKAGAHGLTVTGHVSPHVSLNKGRLTLLAAHPGHQVRVLGSRPLGVGLQSFARSFTLGSGRWKIALRYSNGGVIVPGTSARQTVTVP